MCLGSVCCNGPSDLVRKTEKNYSVKLCGFKTYLGPKCKKFILLLSTKVYKYVKCVMPAIKTQMNSCRVNVLNVKDNVHC